MRLNVYTIYDSKAEAYNQPFYSQTHGTAIRAVLSMMSDPKHPFALFTEDYTLFCIGAWDDEHGVFEIGEAKLNLGGLHEIFKTEVEEL